LDVSITSDMFNYSFKIGMESKLRLFAEHGFGYIHWCDDWNNDVVYAQGDIGYYSQLIRTAGLRCIDVHGSATAALRIDAEEDDSQDQYVRLLENRIEFCSSIGGDAVVIHPPPRREEDYSSSLKRSLRVFEKVRPLCEELSITLAIENCFPKDEEAISFYFDEFPAEFVGFCFDSGHAHINGNFDQLLGFGERLKALHLHDNRGERDDHQPPFWGTIDWNRVRRWIKDGKYKKPINFEITHNPRSFSGNADEYLEYSMNAIQKFINLPID